MRPVFISPQETAMDEVRSHAGLKPELVCHLIPREYQSNRFELGLVCALWVDVQGCGLNRFQADTGPDSPLFLMQPFRPMQSGCKPCQRSLHPSYLTLSLCPP